MADIGISILQLNKSNLTIDFIESLEPCMEQHNIFLSVLDNGSSADEYHTLEDFLQSKPIRYSLAREEKNLGFAKGSNIANERILQEGLEWVCIAANDLVAKDDWLTPLIHLIDDEGFDIVSPYLCSDEKVFYSEKISGSLRSEWYRFGKQNGFLSERTKTVSWVARPPVLMRASTLRAIGGFDESFYPWGYESEDMMLRAASLGYKNCLSLRSSLFHHGQQTAAEIPCDLHKLWVYLDTKWPGITTTEIYQTMEKLYHDHPR